MIVLTKGNRRHLYHGLGYLTVQYVVGPVATIVGLITSYTVAKFPSCTTTGRNLLGATDAARQPGGTTEGVAG